MDSHVLATVGWYALAILSIFIAQAFGHFFFKDRDKRKLMFMMAYLVTAVQALVVPVASRTPVLMGIYTYGAFPLQFAIVIMLCSIILHVWDFERAFRYFIGLVLSHLVLVLAFSATMAWFGVPMMNMIMATLTISLSMYLVATRRGVSYALLFLAVVAYTAAGFVMLADLNTLLPIILFGVANISFALVFTTSGKDMDDGLATFFNVRAELKTTRLSYDQMFNHMPDGVMTFRTQADGGAILTRLNGNAARILGLAEGDVVGKDVRQVLKCSIADDLGGILREVRDSGAAARIKFEQAGRWLQCVIYPSGQVDELIMICTDKTEQKKAEEAMRVSEERYRALVENSKDGIVIIQDGVLRFMNAESSRLIGYTMDEMLDADFLDFVAPGHRESVLQRYMDRMAGREVLNIYEIELLKKDGTTLPVELNAALIGYEGGLADLIFLRDVTKRKQAEDALRENMRKLERFNRLAVGRERRMVELKREINELLCMAGREEKYAVHGSRRVDSEVFDNGLS